MLKEQGGVCQDAPSNCTCTIVAASARKVVFFVCSATARWLVASHLCSCVSLVSTVLTATAVGTIAGVSNLDTVRAPRPAAESQSDS